MFGLTLPVDGTSKVFVRDWC